MSKTSHPHKGAVVGSKIQRILDGAAPRTLDLFAGCGGLSLGFHAAGFELSAAIELDPIAASTYATNFHARDRSSVFSRSRDIRTTPASRIARDFSLGPLAAAIDVIIGGPPCQAYARVGRAKLREVAEHPQAFQHDERSNLYLRYLSYVRQFLPLAVLMENVPD